MHNWLICKSQASQRSIWLSLTMSSTSYKETTYSLKALLVGYNTVSKWQFKHIGVDDGTTKFCMLVWPPNRQGGFYGNITGEERGVWIKTQSPSSAPPQHVPNSWKIPRQWWFLLHSKFLSRFLDHHNFLKILANHLKIFKHNHLHTKIHWIKILHREFENQQFAGQRQNENYQKNGRPDCLNIESASASRLTTSTTQRFLYVGKGENDVKRTNLYLSLKKRCRWG